MAEGKKMMSQEEKMGKAKDLFEEIQKLELSEDELNNICGGRNEISYINNSNDKNNSDVVIF